MCREIMVGKYIVFRMDEVGLVCIVCGLRILVVFIW